MARPAFLERGYWSPKRAAIVIGFTMAAMSTLGPQFYVGPVEDLGSQADQVAKTMTSRIEKLRQAQSQHLMFEQMGALIYLLAATSPAAEGSSQRATLNDLYQLALIDRANPMDEVIGELALAHKLDYRATVDAYNDLVAKARKSLAIAEYKALDDFEKAILVKANAQMANLQKALLAAETAKSDSDATASRRRLHLLILTALGSTLLLAANLMSEKPAAPSPETPEEEAAAERLVRLALEEAKALPAEPPAEPRAALRP